MALNLTPLPGIPMIKPGDGLVNIINKSLSDADIDLQDGDIIVLAQKIVSKSEDRFVRLDSVLPSLEAQKLAEKTDKDPRLVELILQESKKILRTRPGTIIVEHRLGFICANAGIDRSNVLKSDGGTAQEDEIVLLLPKNPDASARSLKHELERIHNAKIGVQIIDSHGRAWRLGTVGITLGVAGIPGLVDLCGKRDLFERELQITIIGAADELAAASSLVMGQADEGLPVVHVRGFPYELRESSLSEILRPEDQDLFR